MRTVLGQQKTTVAHISMLQEPTQGNLKHLFHIRRAFQELLTAAKNESANEDLILQASKT